MERLQQTAKQSDSTYHYSFSILAFHACLHQIGLPQSPFRVGNIEQPDKLIALARLLRQHLPSFPKSARPQGQFLPAQIRQSEMEVQRIAPRGLEGRKNRLSHRRCSHAGTKHDWIHAQPMPHDHCLFLRQRSIPRLARRRKILRQQISRFQRHAEQWRVAVDCRQRHWCFALFQDF